MLPDQENFEKIKFKKDSDTSKSSESQQHNLIYSAQSALGQNIFTSTLKILNYFDFFSLHLQSSKFLQFTPLSTIFNGQKNICQEFHLDQFIQNLQKNLQQKNSQKNQKNNQLLLDKKSYNFLKNYQKTYAKDFQKTILQSKRFKKVEQFTSKLLICQVFPSKHHEIIRIQIQLLYYKTQILILNQLDDSSLNEFGQISDSGSFGSIYFMKFLNQKFCVKNISFENNQRNKLKNDHFQDPNIMKTCQNLIVVLKQYFFILLFQQLQIGPKAHTIGGFDLVIYEDSIEFATEICEEIHTNEEDIQMLKQSLFKMHMLQVVHRDIKPSNIMFSPTFKKNVFIDFGGSEALKETLGEKTMSRFVGTASYCSDQAFRLLSKNGMATDLYYNDIFGLRKLISQVSMQTFLLQERKEKIMNFIDFNKNFMKFEGNSNFELIEMKYSSFVEDEQTFDFMWRFLKRKYFDRIEQVERKILQFLKELKPTAFLRRFFNFEISEITKNLQQFSELKVFVKTENSESLFYLSVDNKKKQSYQHYQQLFKTLQIQFGCFQQQQKQIQKLLNSKENMEKYLQKMQIILQDQNNFYEVKNKSLINFCVIVTVFCCLSQNSLCISVEQKIKVSSNALQIIKKVDKKSLQNLKNPFDCPIADLNSIWVFYHYFFFNVFHQIPTKYKSQMMVRTVSSLCLMGFGKLSKYQIRIVLNNLLMPNKFEASVQNVQIQKKQKRRMQKIVMFWQCKLVFLYFDDVFYAKNQRQQEQFCKMQISQICENELQIMEPKQGQLSPFFKLNHIFYLKIFRQHQNLDDRIIDQLLQILKSPLLKQLQSSSKLIIKWKKLMVIILCYFSNAYKLMRFSQIRKLIEKQQIFALKDNKVILPYIILFYFDQISKNHVQSHFILQKIDEIIGFKKLSLRFELEVRLKITLQKKNLIKAKQIFVIVENFFQNMFICQENMCFIKRILHILSNFLYNYLRDSPDLTKQSINSFESLFDVISMGIQAGMKYFQLKNNFCQQRAFQILSLQKKGLFQLMKQISERGFIQNFASTLIFLGQILEEILDLYEKNQRKSELGIIHKFQVSDKLKLSKKYKDFLVDLKNNRFIFYYGKIWMDIIQKDKQIRQKIKQNRAICTIFASLFLDQRRNKNYIEKSHQVTEILFEEITAEQFENEQRPNTTNFLIAFDFFQVKLLKTSYDPYWCNQIIKMYKICLKKNLLDHIICQQQIVRFLFNSFVYTQKPFSQILSLISTFTMLLKKIPSQKYIQKIKNTFNIIFWCQCEDCLPRKPQNWNRDKFTEFIFSSLDYSKIQQNPYMSLVYFYNMRHKKLQRKIRKKFIIYILKSLSLLVTKVKEIIFPEIYGYIYATIEPYPFDMILEARINRSLLKIPKVRFQHRNQTTIRKYLYLIGQCRKHQQSDVSTLQQLSQKRLIRQYCVLNYQFPPFIRKIFIKKLRRYHEVKQNYRQKQKIIQIINSKKHFLPPI